MGSEACADVPAIAVVGMAGRFPGAADLDQFWRNLRDGVESISRWSESQPGSPAVGQPGSVRAKGMLDDVDQFAASFFGFSPREATLLDPQQRLFLECAHEALESGGYDPDRFEGLIGVYAGSSMSTYLLFHLLPHADALGALGMLPALIANDKDYLATRVSYKLDLRGPSLSVQTACSTSLVAVCQACESLLAYRCDMALAGGVSITLPQERGYCRDDGPVFSPDGRCRAFDARAGGLVVGNGVGVVVLKRLEDALADRDSIHAVIKGFAVNNDGGVKVGFTAPAVDGQAEVIAMAQAAAGVAPETVGYVEAHGTGTAIGDPIEVAALTQAFRLGTEAKGFCALGSVKTNIGHLDAAAGIAGLIKTVLALKHESLPPSLHFEEPNPHIDFAASPFYVNSTLCEWKSGETPRRAGVSSFGIGGTNAHVVLEEAPLTDGSGTSRCRQLLVLSAKRETALERATTHLIDYLKENPRVPLADVAYTLQVGRRELGRRRVLVCTDRADAVDALESRDPKRVLTAVEEVRARPVAFMFSGQGSQYVGMGRELYETEATFREDVDLCSRVLAPHLGFDFREVLYPSPEQAEAANERLCETVVTQPVLFAVEYALARLWMSWGVRPWAMIGHSIGEYVAACLAEVMTLEEGLALVARRGRLMQKLPRGRMMAVALEASELRPLLGSGVSLAALNAPSRCVVSGPTEPVDELARRLAERGVETRPLRTSHAFHSEMVEPLVAEFTEEVRAADLRPPRIPYVSNVTGTWITATEATDPAYWGRHLRQAVRFAEGLHALLQGGDQILLEVGPGNTLTGFARQNPGRTVGQIGVSSLRHPRESDSDVAFSLKRLGQLWLAGATVDWTAFSRHERRRRVRLPTYPFERKRYWIDEQRPEGVAREDAPDGPSVEEAETAHVPTTHHVRPDLETPYVAPRNAVERGIVHICETLLGIEGMGIEDDFFELGGDSLVGSRVVASIRDAFRVEMSMQSLFEGRTVASLAIAVGVGP